MDEIAREVDPLATGAEGILVHPAAEMLPMMSDAEIDELAADIAANGCRRSSRTRQSAPASSPRAPMSIGWALPSMS
jgi:hypothetical protein